MSLIYVITNDVNGKQYVGKTNFSIKKRFREHIQDAKRHRCEKRPLYNAMNKYGVEHFHIEQLEDCSASEAAEREMYWIQKLNTNGNTGYNATLGGDSKHYYDYEEIANKYLELQNQKETVKYFNCDVYTVKVACEEYDVDILSTKEVLRNKSECVVMLPENKIFNSASEAAEYIIFRKKSKSSVHGTASHIRDVCRGSHKTAYGHKWKYIDFVDEKSDLTK